MFSSLQITQESPEIDGNLCYVIGVLVPIHTLEGLVVGTKNHGFSHFFLKGNMGWENVKDLRDDILPPLDLGAYIFFFILLQVS